AAAAVLARRRRARVHPGRLARARPARAGLPPGPVRSRRVRALGRRAPADRGRMGAGGRRRGDRRQLRRCRRAAPAGRGRRRRRARAAVRRRLGMDVVGLHRVPRIPVAARFAGRVQRQVHERPERAARRQLRHAARPRARQLPQLLPAARALAVLGAAPGQGLRVNAVSRLTDLHPTPDDILGDVLAGLSQAPKRLPSKYFYDRRGSELFEQITRQPEYYPTRIELQLLADRGASIAEAVGPRAHVVEYGSGSGRKTRLLLDALEDPVAYTPIEISESALLASVE